MEEIRNIGIIGDTDGLGEAISLAAAGPPKGCPCQQGRVKGEMVMCFFCSDPNAHQLYNRYYDEDGNKR